VLPVKGEGEIKRREKVTKENRKRETDECDA
jgi:hypothetical protein